MLDFIQVENFGCFDKEYTVKFNKLNVIVGPNNSGKSTIFKALNLLRACYTISFNRPCWMSDYYSLVNFDKAVYDKSQKCVISVSIDQKSNIFYITSNQISEDILNSSSVSLSSIVYINSSRKLIDYQHGVGSGYTTSTDHNFVKSTQVIHPSGQNIIQFLTEKGTQQDSDMSLFEEWLQKIDPQIKTFKTPIIKYNTSLSTNRNDGNNEKAINLHFQGNGIQNAVTIIAAIVFSPKNSTIIIEEPEVYQHSNSIEVLVDLFNYAVNELNKQIIIVTHSFEIINAYCSDIGEGTDRGNDHVKANAEDFKLIMVNKKMGPEKIKDYDLVGKKYSDVRSDFKKLLG